MPNHEESLHQFARHTPRILRRQLILQLAELYLTGGKAEDEKDVFTCKPSIQRFNGALLFVDISGFTALSLRLNVEELKNHINEYFTKMLDIVDKHEGDVVKFAGDALFIIWECFEPHGSGDEEIDITKSAVEKAVECGKEINETCSNHKVVIHSFKPVRHNSIQELSITATSSVSEGATLTNANSSLLSPMNYRNMGDEDEVAYLNVHSGVSVGLMAGIDIGVENRWEYFLIGEPLSKVAEAEALAAMSELIICPAAHSALHPDHKSHFSGIVSTVRRLFRRDGNDSKAVTLSCGCVCLKDGYCKVNTTQQPEKKKTNQRKISRRSSKDEHQSTLDNIRGDVKDVYKAFQTRFMKEFLKRTKKFAYAIRGSEDLELCDVVLQKAFCKWVEVNLADDIARHVHHVMRSEYTFSIASRCGVYDRAIEEHFRRALMPNGLMGSPELLEDVVTPIPRTMSRNLLSPLSHNGTPGPSRSSTPLSGHSRTASPVQHRIAAIIAQNQGEVSPKGSPSPTLGFSDAAFNRSQSNSTNPSEESCSVEGSPAPTMRSLGAIGSPSNTARSVGSISMVSDESRNSLLVSSRLTLRRRGEGNNLLMSSFNAGINVKSSMTAEIRTVTVLFIKLAMPHVELLVDSTKRVKLGGGNRFLGKSVNEKIADQLLLDRFQSSMEVLNEALTAHGGQMRQFIVDDKGTVCIGTFGLRGSVSDDNAAAAMEAAHAIIVKMQQMGLQCSIGVTVGKAYCGLVGSSGRHEYAVMGPSTNLSARLMCKAPAFGVICDGETRHRDRTHGFNALADVIAKGYSSLVPTFKPIFAEVEALLNARYELSVHIVRSTGIGHAMSDDTSINSMNSGNRVGMSGKIIERMIGTKGAMTFRDSHNVKVKLHGRVEEVTAVVTYLLGDLLKTPITLPSPADKGLFEFTNPSVFVGVNGTQGIGKSCLISCVADQVATVAKRTSHCNIQVLRGRHDRLSAGIPFSAWKSIIHDMIIRIHRSRKETPKRKKSFNVGLSVTQKELQEAATFIVSVLPAPAHKLLPLLGFIGIVPPDFSALAALGLSKQDLIKHCIDVQIAIIQMYCNSSKNLVFLTMDDVHTFDDASLLLLMEVYSVSKGVVVLFSRRSSGPNHVRDSFAADNGTIVAQFASALYEAGRFQTIEMEGLNKESTTALVVDALLAANVLESDESLFDKVFEVCGGNPFYAFEIAKSMTEKQGSFLNKSLNLHSVRIEEVICHRFDKLKNKEQTLLKIAAVACSNGSTFTLSMLNQVGEHDMPSLEHTSDGLDGIPMQVRNATLLLTIMEKENFICLAASDEWADGVYPELSVELLLENNYQFQFTVTLEQSIIYNLLLDDQKHAIHQSIAEYYKLRRENSDETTTVAWYREEGFHWESACVMNHAMVCYYEAYVGDQDVPKNSDYLDKAFAMYNGMKESTEVMPDPQGISSVGVKQLLIETFQNDGKAIDCVDVLTGSLKLDRVFQIFDGDSSMLETGLAVMLEVCRLRMRRFEGAVYTQFLLEDTMQMILLTKAPFLMSSKYLANLVSSVTQGMCRVGVDDMHFCLYDHFSHFCFRAFSMYIVNFCACSSFNYEHAQKATYIAKQYLQIVRNNEPVVDVIQALCMNALILNKVSDVNNSLTFVQELRSIYVFEEHSKLLIEAYGADHVIFLLARTAKHYLISEPHLAAGFAASCIKYATQTTDLATLTSCVFRIVSVLAYSNRYVDAQVVWTKYCHVAQTTKTHKREQVPVKVLQLYSEWLSRRMLLLSHKNNPHISSLMKSTDVNEVVTSVEQLMKLEQENAAFHYRQEVLLVFADICLLKMGSAGEEAGKKEEKLEVLCKQCCKHLHAIMSVATVDTRTVFNKASCVKIATEAVKLVSDSQNSHRCLEVFRYLFSSQTLLHLRNEAEINHLHTMFENLAALYQVLHG